MKVITNLGADTFYMAVIPVIFWCVSKPFGFSLGMVTAVSSHFNILLKFAFRVPRPYVTYPHLNAPEFLLKTGTGWSFPSGHAQGTATFWTYVAASVKKRWVTWVAAVVIVLVSFTRVYATVHYPSDVVVGAVLGIAAVLVFIWAQERLARSNPIPSIGGRIGASIAVPGLVFLVSSFDPNLASESAQTLGFVMGLGIGYTLEEAYIRYDVRAALPVQVLKALLGLGVLMGLRVGLKAILPPAPFFSVLRYAVMALWATYVAPLAFKALFPARS
jgi:hypothetical protein